MKEFYDNILKFDNCYGCGVCVAVCPLKIISIKLDEDGFYRPHIEDIEKCTMCKLCLKICAYEKDSVASLPKFETEGFSSWSNDKNLRYRCTSGGFVFESAISLFDKGYLACGVKYNVEKRRAEHFIAVNEDEFIPSIGSKYIPSLTSPAFSELVRDKKYVVVGTPCQIDSLRHYIRLKGWEDNFILIDFFCHGVPSMLMWKKYLSAVERKLGHPVTNFHWRDKRNGWHDSTSTSVLGDDNQSYVYFSAFSRGDLFYKFFFGDKCLNRCCYEKCKYKILASAADIRVGDLWGKAYRQEDRGVSGVLVFTKKGHEVIKAIGGCTFVKHPIDEVTDYQMVDNAKPHTSYNWVKKRLRTNDSLACIYQVSQIIDVFDNGNIQKKVAYYSKRILQKLGLCK